MRKTTFHIDNYIRADDAFHFARKSLAKRFPNAAHDHDFFEVFLIESGQTSHWVNGETQQLEPGHLTFIRPNDVHAFSADRTKGCQIINVMFRVETAKHLTNRYAKTIESAFFDSRAALPEMHMLDPVRFARAINVAQQLQTAHRSLARIEEFLLVLTNRVADAAGGIAQNAPRWFAEACSAAQSQTVFSKGAAGFIAAAGRSHEHVCRTCKAVTGLTPSEYINQVRIEYAAHLLRSDERSIDDVVNDCGFDNSSYFYRLFRRQYGTTPRAYRLENLRDPFQLIDRSDK
ncbi:AraC family transcriptional regulator [Roseobacter sp. CCS2]|uniref:AraC family transcriptional regulator n=1 Tax=Roseobacter sp. CCS2 TaxID=391593 RepID=UPI0000F3C509|nr:AraC family transcriptional regulator [Roseobacter sp. CCS2]EBA11556.1 transcriptional regulator, AraC family protein [Roseobacter sp. CCS2]